MNASGLATATTAHRSELLLYLTLLQLAVIVMAGRVGGALALRVGQSPAVGEIIIGILLGPSLFGWLAPATFSVVFKSAPPEPLLILSQLGLILLMFQIGMEFDFAQVAARANRAAVLRIASAALCLPFAAGFGVGYWLAPNAGLRPRIDTALFVATAFSITALPILGRIMIEFDLTRSRVGVVAICAAAINDVAGWLLLAFVTALTASQFDVADFAVRIALLAAFGLASVWVVRPLLKKALRRSAVRRGAMSGNVMGGLLVTVFCAAMATHRIGIFAIFGGFMMGVILYDEAELVAAWRERVGGFVTVFFLPIFFTYTGLRTSVGGLDSVADWAWCLTIVVTASSAKWLSAYSMARCSNFSHPEAAMLGYMMNTRALMELIVINVGLDLGVISNKVFTMLVIMAIVSTVVTTPALRHYLSRIRIQRSA